MSFYADLHIHSKYSRATSRDCDLENLAFWGRKKGISVIGTGDFTHPAWIEELQKKLIPAEPGLFRLKPEIEREVSERLPASCQGLTRFMLSVEVSTIYKKGDKTRKVHHLLYAPNFEQALRINQKLGKIGNIRSDGRPILGLDSRHLLEIVLEAGEGCYLVPAHIWTPWFSVLGSKSGFDRVSDCYGDLASHVFAVETGLSSDPEMNWRVSGLDCYRLVSNSDAHSPPKLGREASVFECDLDYFAILRSLQTGQGFGGTVEFFPEEGKYHLDGHRKCGVCLSPEESKARQGLCPACHKPLTLGVLYRVEELADRPLQQKPEQAQDFQNLIPLPEMISEIRGTGPSSKGVLQDYENLLHRLGSELSILSELPLEDIQRQASSSLLPEAIGRMRKGEVIREAGYDGEYGVIRLFKPDELRRSLSLGFGLPEETQVAPKKSKQDREKILAHDFAQVPNSKHPKKTAASFELDPEQDRAAQILHGPLLITAGPGSGKTRTLTQRIYRLIAEQKVPARQCLTITFTRKAAEEMRERLQRLLPNEWREIPITTFHGFAWKLLQENREMLGLQRGFRIASEAERKNLLAETQGLSARKAEQFLRRTSEWKRLGCLITEDEAFKTLAARYEETCFEKGWLDYEDLLILTVKLLEENSPLRSHYQAQFPWISIDEYQDIDALQYRFIRLLCPEGKHLCAIGDPNQSIYSFRGANVEFFLRFEQDFPDAKKVSLTRNYRSGLSIVRASSQVIVSSNLQGEIDHIAFREDTGKIAIHEASTDKAEAEFIVQTIEALLGGSSFFALDSGRSTGESHLAGSFSDFAVLYRSEAQLGPLEEALGRSGFPFQRHSHGKLSEHNLVQELLQRLEQEPNLEISQALDAIPQEQARMHEAILLGLKKIEESSGRERDAFLSAIHLEREIDLWDERADRISLMTLHASKGLEFPFVFLTGCEAGILPMYWGEAPSPEELNEERRLFYVGMTRAKERLFLSRARKRLWRGKLREQAPSPFLFDIEKELLEAHRATLRAKAGAKSQMSLF